jgi:methylthioribose-1-phosphate isomerase
LCAESRPGETVLSDRLTEFVSRGYETTVITDNMMGFCLSRKKVALVFLFYQRTDEEYAYCQGGSLLAAILARELKVPCHLYPTGYNPEIANNGSSLFFAGDAILPRGVKSFIPQAEKISLSYISEKW